MRCTFVLCLALALELVLRAQVARADVFAGQQLYQSHCANCHGFDGVPLVPGSPDFSRGEGLLKPDNMIFEIIKEGTSQMPRYEGILRDREILNLIDFLRTLPR